MAFWSSKTVLRRVENEKLIIPFVQSRVKHGAYELTMGSETFVTSADDSTKLPLAEGQQVMIPAGQFALLITEEEVAIPDDAIGLISIKAGIKFRGLVNVSGFHVDPGFIGKLKFSVYNAGSQAIILARRQPVFLLWFCKLDEKTDDLYKGDHAKQAEISSEDVMRIQGKVHSPAVLDKRLTDLEHSMTFIKSLLVPIFVAIVLWFVKTLWEMSTVIPLQQSAPESHISQQPETSRDQQQTAPPSSNSKEKSKPENEASQTNKQR